MANRTGGDPTVRVPLSDIEGIASFCSCPKCNKRYSDRVVPYVFNCGHSMCEQCMRRSSSKRPNEFYYTCAVCSEQHTAARPNVDLLAIARRIGRQNFATPPDEFRGMREELHAISSQASREISHAQRTILPELEAAESNARAASDLLKDMSFPTRFIGGGMPQTAGDMRTAMTFASKYIGMARVAAQLEDAAKQFNSQCSLIGSRLVEMMKEDVTTADGGNNSMPNTTAPPRAAPNRRVDTVEEFAFKKLKNSLRAILNKIIHMLVDRAIFDPTYCETYVRLWNRQLDVDLETTDSAYMLYGITSVTKQEFDYVTDVTMDGAPVIFRDHESLSCFKRRKAGVINLIATLFHENMMPVGLLYKFMGGLLEVRTAGSSNGPEAIPHDNLEQAIRLLSLVGKKLEAEELGKGNHEIFGSLVTDLCGVVCDPNNNVTNRIRLLFENLKTDYFEHHWEPLPGISAMRPHPVKMETNTSLVRLCPRN